MKTKTLGQLLIALLVLGACDGAAPASRGVDIPPVLRTHANPHATDKLTPPLKQQGACTSLVPALIGGAIPDGNVVAIRWLGTSNYEVSFHDKVIVMDTYYDRPARTRSVGFTAEQVTRADAILIGHAHSDHISDVATVAAQTHAKVYGSAISTAEAQALGVPPEQTVTVKGDNTEEFHVGEIKIQPTHIIHSSVEPGLIPALQTLYSTDSLGPLTAEQTAEAAAIRKKGSSDPNIVPLGTMGFTLTLPGEFHIVWFDSVSSISPEEQQLADQLNHHVEVALLPYTPHPIAETQLSWTYQHVQLFQPDIFEPTHHDHIFNAWLDNGVQPLFMMIRDSLPATRYYAPLYRSAMCVETMGPNRGNHYLGK